MTRKNFIANLGSEGWKYFNLYSLNAIFVQKFNEQNDEDKGDIILDMFEMGLKGKFGHPQAVKDKLGNPQTRSTMR